MEVILSIFLAVLGAVLASFTAVVAERVHTGQSFLSGRSRCNACRRQLTVIDLLPIVSWTIFGGRCRTCHARIPGMYALFETAFSIVFVFSFLSMGLSLRLIVFLLAVVVLGFIVLYDLRHTIVPMTSTILLITLSVIFALLSMTSVQSFLITLLVACLIALAFFLVYALSRGRAMGLGDTPVAFALSLLIGSHAFVGLVFSFWVGAVVGILILVLRRGGPTMGIEVPFVPFLAIGYLLAFFTQWNPFIF